MKGSSMPGGMQKNYLHSKAEQSSAPKKITKGKVEYDECRIWNNLFSETANSKGQLFQLFNK